MYKLNIIVGYGDVVFNVDLTYSHTFFWQCKNNSLYITGESNHLLGREAKGNISDVWKFNFATSFSFSLIEQLVRQHPELNSNWRRNTRINRKLYEQQNIRNIYQQRICFH